MSELPHEYSFCHLKAYPKCDYCHGEYELLTGTHSTSMPGMNEIWNLNGIDFMIFFSVGVDVH